MRRVRSPEGMISPKTTPDASGTVRLTAATTRAHRTTRATCDFSPRAANRRSDQTPIPAAIGGLERTNAREIRAGASGDDASTSLPSASMMTPRRDRRMRANGVPSAAKPIIGSTVSIHHFSGRFTERTKSPDVIARERTAAVPSRPRSPPFGGRIEQPICSATTEATTTNGSRVSPIPLTRSIAVVWPTSFRTADASISARTFGALMTLSLST